MSLLPYFFHYRGPQWPVRLLDQHFALAQTAQGLVTASTSPIISRFKPWKPQDPAPKVVKDKWVINIDVQHFAPDEITVKYSKGSIIVEGKHEEKKDEFGFISRQFSRRFQLPEDTNPDGIESRLSSDGVLTVVAPRNAEGVTADKSVPITHTGPVRKDVINEAS